MKSVTKHLNEPMAEWSCPNCDTHVNGWSEEQIAVLKYQHTVKHDAAVLYDR